MINFYANSSIFVNMNRSLDTALACLDIVRMPVSFSLELECAPEASCFGQAVTGLG